MSQERILKSLAEFGLKNTDAKVYLYLATKGARNTGEMVEALNLPKQRIYKSLRRLCSREIVSVAPVRPKEYSAVVLSQLIELLLKAKIKEANGIEENRDEILSYWQSLIS